MKNLLTRSAALAAVMVLLLSLNSEMSAQLILEDQKDVSSLSYEVGLSVSKLPRSIVGEEISQIPMLELGMNYYASSNLKVYSGLSTCYLANCLKAGAEYVLMNGSVYLAVADEYKVCYGNAQMDGFDATNLRLVNSPKIRAGLVNPGMDVYLIASANFLQYEKSTFGGNVLPGRPMHLSGVEAGFEVVYKELGVGSLVIGLSLQCSEPDYKTWVAFTEKMQWNLVPKIHLGLKL